jgi:hypothetical protein
MRGDMILILTISALHDTHARLCVVSVHACFVCLFVIGRFAGIRRSGRYSVFVGFEISRVPPRPVWGVKFGPSSHHHWCTHPH